MDENRESIRNSVAGLEQVMASLNGAEGTFGRLLNDEQTANSVVATIESAQGTFDNIEALTEELRGGQGTIGKLIYDEKLYNDIRTNKNGIADVPWFIVFVVSVRPEKNYYQSDFVMNTMKILADENKSKIRFGYIDVEKNEHIKESFEVYVIPMNFYCVPEEGKMQCHEMKDMQVGYKPIRKFITDEW